MSSTINTNIPSLTACRSLVKSQGSVATSMQRLSSGLRVNSAKDDAAGLAIASRMEANIRGATVAIRNVNDGISALQTAEGALATCTEMLQRIREILVQGANGTNSSSDRSALGMEAQSLMNEIGNIFGRTEFNGEKLLMGNSVDPSTNTVTTTTWQTTIQVGASASDALKINVFDASLDQYGDPIGYPNLVYSGIDPTTGLPVFGNNLVGVDANMSYFSNVEQSLNAIIGARVIIGGQLNRLDAVINNLLVQSGSLQSARGRIMDADFAKESSELSRSQILQQSGTAMIAQANNNPAMVLQLLKSI